MPRAKSPRNGNSTSKKITPITQGVAQENKKVAVAADMEDEIRRRAYELFEERGRVPGFEHEDWLTAEREIHSRRNFQSA